MKYIKIMIALLIIITAFAACKKDQIKVEPEKKVTSSLKGCWKGTYYNNDQQTTTFDLSFQLNDNDNLDKLTAANEKEAEGKWSIEGTQFNATYQDLPLKMTVFSMTGYYDMVSGKITGTYINSASLGTIHHFVIGKQ